MVFDFCERSTRLKLNFNSLIRDYFAYLKIDLSSSLLLIIYQIPGPEVPITSWTLYRRVENHQGME